MIVVRDPESIERVWDPAIRELLSARLAMLGEEEPYDPSVSGYFIVLEPGDQHLELDRQLGFPVLSNRWDGSTFGEPGFAPSTEILEEYPTCYDLVFILSDDGYGVEIFVPKQPGVDDRLLALCEQFARPAPARAI